MSQVTSSLKNLDALRALMRTVRALLTNPHICLEPYVHQLIPVSPPIFTMRVELIGHFKPCMTEIYLYI